MVERPGESEYAPFYAGYIARIPAERVLEILERHPVSVRALAFIMAGHVSHHLALLGERYQVPGLTGTSPRRDG